MGKLSGPCLINLSTLSSRKWLSAFHRGYREDPPRMWHLQSAHLLLLSRALPMTCGGISLVDCGTKCFYLPAAFTVHKTGGLFLEIGTPGTGIPHWCAVKACRVSTQQSTEQSGNLSRVQGSCHRPGSKEVYSVV